MGLACLAAGLVPGLSRAGEAFAPPNRGADAEPLMLDLSPFFWERFVTPRRTNTEMVSVSGRQVFDGLPFQVDGRACLYGIALASNRGKPRSAYPDIRGVRVGRAFDELHLLHATQFTDREGEIVARVRLNYADGTVHEFPIGYGIHVRDWQRLQSEEREIYTDPDTKVIWRGPGVERFKSTTRMSKTRLVNPFPNKVVRTIDFLSTGRVASYDVAAATVARADPNRPVTPPVPLDRPEHNFDGLLQVRVVDEAGRPVEGVLVSPNISVAGSRCATVATPLYTSTDGSGLVRYPKAESTCLYFVLRKEGWQRIEENPWVWLSQIGEGTNGIVITLRMRREPTVVVAGGEPRPAITVGAPVAAGTPPATPPGSGEPGPAVAQTGSGPARLVMLIHYPAGSTVRIEYVDDLSDPDWKPLMVLTNLPYSPFPVLCGGEAPEQPQRFYQAVLVP